MEGLDDFGALEGGGATSGADCAERWRVMGVGGRGKKRGKGHKSNFILLLH